MGKNAQFTTRRNAFLPPFTLKILKHASKKEIWQEEILWKEKERKKKRRAEGAQADSGRSHRCFSVSLPSDELLYLGFDFIFEYTVHFLKRYLQNSSLQRWVYLSLYKYIAKQQTPCCLKIN